MSEQRSVTQIERMLREIGQDRVKGISVQDACRKIGISEFTYYRCRRRFDPTTIDQSRRVRELEGEVERLKRIVAELMLDKQMLQGMLQDLSKKSGDGHANAYSGRLPRSNVWHIAKARDSALEAAAFELALPGAPTPR